MTDMDVTPADAGSEPMDANSAANHLSQLLQGSPNEATPSSVDDSEKPDVEEPETAQEYEAEDGSEGDQEALLSDEGEPDTDSEDDAGNEPEPSEGLITLPDGTQATVEEVTRWRDTRKNLESDFTKKTMALAEERKQAQAKVEQLQQQEQFLSQNLPVAMQVLQASIPPAPDPALRDYDLSSYIAQKEAHEGAKQRLNQLYATQQAMQAKQQEASQAARQAAINENRAKLLEAMPELKNDTKRQEMQATLSEGIKAYGFEPNEMENVYDYRVIQALSDAVKYRRLMAEKPKVEGKAKQAPPVQKPGKRKSSAEQRAQAKKSQFDRLKQTGSAKDGAAVLAQLLRGS